MKTLIIFLIAFSAFAALDLQKPMEQVDDWCMDTYCGGDYNYYSPVLSYDEKTNLFRISFTAEDWYDGEFLLPIIDKIVLPRIADHTIDWHTDVIGKKQTIAIEKLAMEPSYWEEKGLRPVVHFSCYFALAEENKTQNYLDEYLYYITLDCVDGFTQVLYR